MTNPSASPPERSTILVVDDDPVMQQALHDVLVMHDHRVVTAATGEEGLALLDRADLVLLDGMLPGRDGWDICREIKRLHGDGLPVIIVTARAEGDAIVRTFEAGADDYVAKPFRSVELLARVESRIRTRRAEAQLSATQAYLRHLVGSSPAVIYAREPTPPFRARFITDNVRDRLGFPAASFISDTGFWASRLHPDDAARLPDWLSDRSQPHPRVLEYRFRHADGEHRWIRDEIAEAPGEDGAITELIGSLTDITGRRQAEEALRASEATLRLILSQLPAIIWTTDPRLRVTSCTGRGLEVLGLRPDQVVGSEVHALLGGGATEAEVTAVHQDALRGERCSHTLHLAERVLQAYVEPLHDSDGSIVGVLGLAHDTTDTRRAQEALRQREEHFRALIENAQDLIAEMDAGGWIRYVSPSVERILGYGMDEMIGHNVLDLVHFDDRPAVLEIIAGAGERPGERIAVELRFRQRDGSWRVLEAVGRNLAGDAVEHGVVFNARDVTDRRAAEDQLHESERRYRAFFEEDLSGNYICFPDGTIRECNAAFARIFGYSAPDTALGDDLAGLFPDRRQFDSLLRRLRERRRLEQAEFEMRSLDGDPVHISQNVIGTFDEAGDLVEFKGYMADITERKQLEERLLHSERMEAVARLAGGIAHDYNNLLTVIRGNTALLLLDTPEDTHGREELEEIEEAAARATEITNQMLAFSRRQLLQPRVLDINGMIAEMERPLRRLLGGSIELVTRLDPALRAVEVDPAQLRQVLRSLASNARDAMPHGGRVMIETANHSVGEDETRTAPVEPGEYAILSVQDTGLGMSPEVRARAFEPFFTTKEVGQGTGMGLSSVHGIVEQSGGAIELASEEGEGTSLRIFFPVTGAPLPATR